MNQTTDTTNDHLTAAAPELLRSLNEMVDFYSINCVGENDPETAKYAVAIKRRARLAIAKAMWGI